MLTINATIKGIKYRPLLCKNLVTIDYTLLNEQLAKSSAFILKLDDKNHVAVSRWVSPKRTRSYPHAAVYNTLSFTGKKVTIIPVVKDEGAAGDRDFVQWDTISLMSLLGVYVIPSYYKEASRSRRSGKITRQRFDIEHIDKSIQDLSFYQADALHWNLDQAEKIPEISKQAIAAYQTISQRTNIPLHSFDSTINRFEQLNHDVKAFQSLSRQMAQQAQLRESVVHHPNENIRSGEKSTITIKNFLGGLYYFTADEARIENDRLYLIECKHSRRHPLPSIADIRDGLLKMVLFTNLSTVEVDQEEYHPNPILRLTSENRPAASLDSPRFRKLLESLNSEAEMNRFGLLFN